MQHKTAFRRMEQYIYLIKLPTCFGPMRAFHQGNYVFLEACNLGTGELRKHVVCYSEATFPVKPQLGQILEAIYLFSFCSQDSDFANHSIQLCVDYRKPLDKCLVPCWCIEF